MPLVAGSTWIIEGSAYQLQSCPAGYELVSVTEQCEYCPASYYCIGGTTASAACPEGFFAIPGAQSFSDCQSAVFVQVEAILSISQQDFNSEQQVKYVQALANAAGTTAGRVIIQSLALFRRSLQGTLDVVSKVAAQNNAEANTIFSNLNQHALDTALQKVGLPPATLESAIILLPTQLSSNEVAWIAGTSVSTGVCLILVFSWLLFFSVRMKESAEERFLRSRVKEIRTRLEILPKHGFVTAKDRRPLWKRNIHVMHLRQSHLEAAARLSMMQDFDINQFDAFCLSLETDDPSTSGSRVRKSLLRDWLLEICRQLICPDIPNLNETPQRLDDEAVKLGFVISAREPGARFKFFLKKVIKTRMWADDYDESLFSRLQLMAKDYMDKISEMCDIRFEELSQEPGGYELIQFTDVRDQRSSARHASTL